MSISQEWVFGMVAMVIFGLIGIIYAVQTKRLDQVEKWRENMPRPEDVLTPTRHDPICNHHLEDLKNNYLELKFKVWEERFLVMGKQALDLTTQAARISEKLDDLINEIRESNHQKKEKKE